MAAHAGWAPHLDLQAIEPADLALIPDILNAPWLGSTLPAGEGSGVRVNLEQQALAQAAQNLVPQHFQEVRERREQMVDKTLAASMSGWSRRSTSGRTVT